MTLSPFDRALLLLLNEDGMMHTFEMGQRLGVTEEEMNDGMFRLQGMGLVRLQRLRLGRGKLGSPRRGGLKRFWTRELSYGTAEQRLRQCGRRPLGNFGDNSMGGLAWQRNQGGVPSNQPAVSRMRYPSKRN